MPGHDQSVVNITNAAIASYKSNSSSTSGGGDSLTATSYTSSGDGDLGAKVGLGVGIPPGVLVLGIVAWLFYREWVKKHGASVGAAGAGKSGSGAAYESVGTSSPMEQPGGGVVGGFATAYQRHGDQMMMGQQT